jgi:hypothetical protein
MGAVGMSVLRYYRSVIRIMLQGAEVGHPRVLTDVRRSGTNFGTSWILAVGQTDARLAGAIDQNGTSGSRQANRSFALIARDTATISKCWVPCRKPRRV